MEIKVDLLQAISQAQEGKEEGFNKIYSSTYKYVYFRAKSVVKEEDEAWDVLQEVYIVAYKSITKLEKPENLYAWLGGIAYNLGMKALRKKKEILLDEDGEEKFEELRSTDKDFQPEEYIENQQTSSIVKELINQLPELQKAAVIAYYYDELSVKDIAQLFECSEGTIKSRLNYARQFLKQAVEIREKKDRIKLRSITIPTIFMALRMLSEDASVSAQAAQMAYNSICSAIGVTASVIGIGATTGASVAGGMTAASGASTASGMSTVSGMGTVSGASTVSGMGVAGGTSTAGGMGTVSGVSTASGMGAAGGASTAGGMSTVGSAISGAQTIGTAAKTGGIIAKFMAATSGAKVLTASVAMVVCISTAVGGAAIINSLGNKPTESSITLISPTPVEEQDATSPVIPTAMPTEEPTIAPTPTALPDTNKLVNLTPEEAVIFGLIIQGLTDSIDSGYVKGITLTDEQMMGIAYQLLYSICVRGGNPFGYPATSMAYEAEDFDFEGDQLFGMTYEIPKEDIDLLLNTILGRTITEHRAYEGFMYQEDTYYLHSGISYAGFKDYWFEDKAVSNNYRDSRKHEAIARETRDKDSILEGIREIGYSGTDGVELIRRSSYRIEFEATEPTKFGRYSLISFSSEEIDQPTVSPTTQPTIEAERIDYSHIYEIFKEYLLDYDEHILPIRYKDYEFSEYFIYDWDNNEPPILIIRDYFNKRAIDYYDIHYLEDKDELLRNFMSIPGTRDSVFYKKDNGIIEVRDDEEDAAHMAYFYHELTGLHSEREELWFWYTRTDGSTFNYDPETYEKRRAEVEALEKITWYKVGDFTPFE